MNIGGQAKEASVGKSMSDTPLGVRNWASAAACLPRSPAEVGTDIIAGQSDQKIIRFIEKHTVSCWLE